MEIVKHYKDNKPLRDSFNALAEETFGLNFEQWYQNGFWTDCYEPYSVVIDGEVAANVSVNRTDMVIGGQRRKLVQLGTVMTKQEYRNRGLIRAIMAEIDRDCADAEGMYLFAGDHVVDFYPKFGFVRGKEYRYTKRAEQSGPCRMAMVPMHGPEGWARLRAAMELGEPHSACAMAGNPGLFFFYVAGFMQENVYYCETLDAWAVAETEGEELILHNVFCPQEVTLAAVIDAFGGDIRTVTLGFAPADSSGWACEEYHEEDCTFFVKGAAFGDFEARRLRIPGLSHA